MANKVAIFSREKILLQGIFIFGLVMQGKFLFLYEYMSDLEKIYIFDINRYSKPIFYSSDTFAIDADSVTSCYMCGFASMPACISGHPGVRVGNTNICTGRNKTHFVFIS